VDSANVIGCDLVGEVIRTFGEVRLRVFGSSMTPSILPGDVISIQRTQINEISSGEVILFSQNGRLFAHRVIARAGNPNELRLIARGDRLRHNDPPVSSSELLGRVISVERGGRIIDFSARNSEWMSPVIRLLQTSDHVAYLYLRLASFRRMLFSKKAECRP
jgi:signal peptidase I